MKVIQPRQLNVRKTVIVGGVVLAFIFWHIVRPPPKTLHPAWQGQTMGTYYVVKLANHPLADPDIDNLQTEVTDLLDRLNAEFSTYMDDSPISRFNATASTKPFAVSTNFVAVVKAAIGIARDTDGMFDPTLGPLVELWGFGSKPFVGQDPSDSAITNTLAFCGYRRVELLDQGAIRKQDPRLQLDLNALAKGYAADQVLSLLERHGFTNAYVELGGDSVARGINPRGTPWTIGIETPNYGSAPGESIQSAVALSNAAIATSGDYRNYRQSEGHVRSHIINPRTGRPVQHTVASVTVTASDGMTADALATALFVMGPEQGLIWVETIPDAEALFILRDDSNRFEETRSPGFHTISIP